MLLELPDPCLLAVLHKTAHKHDPFDQRSLLNAARAHSRLHHLAALVLRSIKAQVKEQQHADSMVQYLSKHGQHIDSLELWGSGPLEDTITLQELPPRLHLTSLHLLGLCVQLQPGNGFQGVLGAAAAAAEAPPLKQLKLVSCELLDREEGLAAALSLMPALESLEVSKHSMQDPCLQLPADLFAADLQQLTHLKLHGVTLRGPSQEQWQGLSRLESLDLAQHMYAPERYTIPVSLLQNAHHHHLTRIVLADFAWEPAILGGKIKLQHLKVSNSWETIIWGTWATQMLSHLQHLKQLTHLDLPVPLKDVGVGDPPAAAYSALTASNKLHFLGIYGWSLPAGAWQHMFDAGRQLPHLTLLDISGVKNLAGGTAAAPEGGRLVSCCPRLQSLDMSGLRCTAGTLASLAGLSALHRLSVGTNAGDGQGLIDLAQLTGLRELFVSVPNSEDMGLLLQLTELKQLTLLRYDGQWDGGADVYTLECEVRRGRDTMRLLSFAVYAGHTMQPMPLLVVAWAVLRIFRECEQALF